MKNTAIYFLVILCAFVFLGAGCNQLSDQESVEIEAVNIEAPNIDTAADKSETKMVRAGSYEIYSSEKLVLAKDGTVVLFFHAPWCPYCKAADGDIKSNLSAIPENFTILKVDYDSSAALKKQYGVTYQHTFVKVDSSGQLLKKWSGSFTLSEIIANAN